MKMKGLLKIACIVPAVVMAVASGAQSPSAGHKGIVPAGDAFLEQLQKRDSVLIADQLRYGFRLENVKAGTALGLPDLSHGVMDSIEVVSDWKLDTLKFRKKKNEMDLEGSFVITSFDEGNYRLPDIAVGRMAPDGTVDTLVFKGMDLQVMSMPVDTATYKPHDIKGQIRYPVTFKEVLPYILGVLLFAARAGREKDIRTNLRTSWPSGNWTSSAGTSSGCLKSRSSSTAASLMSSGNILSAVSVSAPWK